MLLEPSLKFNREIANNYLWTTDTRLQGRPDNFGSSGQNFQFVSPKRKGSRFLF